MAGAASVSAFAAREFFLNHHISLHPPTHLNLSFSSSNSTTTTRSIPFLRLKTPNSPSQVFFPLLPLSFQHPPHTCRVSISADETEAEEEEEEEEGNGASENEERRRLYVGNLPYSMTEPQLAEAFQEAGEVDSVEVVYDRVTDRSRGFAFVTMASVEEAKEAIRMFDGSQIGGRTAKVNFPEVPRGGEREVMEQRMRRSFRGFIDSPYKLYAGNLAWSLTSEILKEAFQDQPGFLSAKVIYERETGRSRGFGFLSFASAEDAESALNAMNGVEVEGRPLRLNLTAQREGTTVAAAPQMQETATEPLSSNAI